VAENLVELPPREMLVAKLHEAIRREGQRTRNVHLGISRMMDARQKARAMKVEALGYRGAED
jgi:hypothetical protein